MRSGSHRKTRVASVTFSPFAPLLKGSSSTCEGGAGGKVRESEGGRDRGRERGSEREIGF